MSEEVRSETPAVAETEKQTKKREAAESASPYSISVGQVYDGPLDLLLDLIRKQDIDIYDIPIGRITAQFLAYVEGLKQTEVDAAADFIYVASLLIHIKSRMLLPRMPAEGADGEQEDPRRELVERLLEHERFKNAAQMLMQKQQIEAATWTNPAIRQFRNEEGEQEIAADTVDLVRVFREILDRARQRPILNVDEEAVTVSQMLDYVRRRLIMEDRPLSLSNLLRNTRSERALICMFLALLELVRLQAVLLRQDGNFNEVYIKKHASFETIMNNGIAQATDDWR
jgi:segregation and condensation protein A